MSALPDIVVGSGPSGLSVAEALRAAGRQVLIVDGGKMLEPDRLERKQALAASDPSAWSSADLAVLAGPAAARGEVPDKLSFGSDFPYAAPARATRLERHGVGAKPSYAVGGLSTVWGSALLPFREADMGGWPIASADLAEGYAAAARMMPLSAIRDGLEPAFPLYQAPAQALAPSRQARAVLERMSRHRERLAAAGLSFGQARLAVSAESCVRCGLCLQGCPHDLIFSAGIRLAHHRAAGLSYETGLIVREVVEEAGGVEVRALRADGTKVVLRGARVFLAAGTINTTEIVLRSLGWLDRPVTILDAQYVLAPVLAWRGTRGVADERLHTLCQAFLELDDPGVSAFTVHLQLYTYSSILRDLVRAKLGPLASMIPLGPVMGRLMVLQSYLHSAESGRIEATLRSGASSERLVLEGRPNPRTKTVVARLADTLLRLSHATGFVPVRPLIEVTEPGRGFHIGGSFPMGTSAALGTTDGLGRPAGLSRVHLVDASVLPSIPATTITFPVMANAYRIGAAVARSGVA